MPTIVIPYYTEVTLHFPGTLVVDDVFPMAMPYDGEIVGYRGTIADVGAGAGTSTDLQVENDDTGAEYFSTQPTFEVDSATDLLEGGALIDSPTFIAGAVLRGRVRAISTAPKDAYLVLLMKFYKTVTAP